MKAEHRHDLKTNELAELIANLPQWSKKHLAKIIVVSVVVAVVAGSYVYFKYQRDVMSVRERLELTDLGSGLWKSKNQIVAAQAQGEDVSFMLLRLATSLENFADRAKDRGRAAFALVEAAEALRSELHYRPRMVGKQARVKQIQRAQQDCNRALEEASSIPPLAALARFGLGLCAEELGNFDEAEQIYRQLVSDPDYEATTAAIQAGQRLELMGQYKQEVVFRPRPRPRPRPAEQMPPIPLRPRPGADINLVGVRPTAPNVAADTSRARPRVGADVNGIETDAVGANQPGQ